MKIPFHFSKRYTVVVVSTVLVICVIATALVGIHVWESRNTKEPAVSVDGNDQGLSEVIVDGQRYQRNAQVESVLLLGIDKFEDDTWGSHINNQQADVIVLAIFDHESQAYSLWQLNRDTMAKIKTLGVTGENGGVVTAQLALAHAYGTGKNDSARNVLHAVSDLLYGVEIEHFMSLKMDAVPILNDAVGGVEVELLEDFSYLDSSYTKGAVVTLQGDESLSYIRARDTMEDSTNIARMERQRQYISAWSDAYSVACENDDEVIQSMMADAAEYMITDMSLADLEKLGGWVDSYDFNGIITTKGESIVGEEHMEFYVDEAVMQRQVLSLFYRPVE